MALSADQLNRAWHWATIVDPRFGQQFTKPQLVAAATATDTWIDQNAASFVAALPQQFRSADAALLTILFSAVAGVKAGII